MADRNFSEIAKLNERYSKDPTSKIFVQLADAYRKTNMIDEALDVLTKGIQIHPQYALAYLIQGKCYFDKRIFSQAREAVEKALALDPQNIMALRMLAQICESLKDETGQYNAYKDIIAIDPSDEAARKKLSHLEPTQKKPPLYTLSVAYEWEKQGNLSEALKIYEYLSAMDTTDMTLHAKLKELKQKLGMPEVKIDKEKVEGLQTTEDHFKTETTSTKESRKPAGPEILADLFGPSPTEQPVTPVTTPTPEPHAEKVKEPEDKVMNLADFLAAEFSEKSEEITLEPIVNPTPIPKIEVTQPEPRQAPPKVAQEPLTHEAPKTKEDVVPPPAKTVEPTPPKEAITEKEPPRVEKTAEDPSKPPAPQKVEDKEVIEKIELDKKPKEEDFKSFQEWLSGLLK